MEEYLTILNLDNYVLSSQVECPCAAVVGQFQFQVTAHPDYPATVPKEGHGSDSKSKGMVLQSYA